MTQYSMVVLIVFAVMATAAFKQWAKLQTEKARAGAGEENDALREQVGRLEERVKVLERIVTDKAGRLKEEIDAL